MDAKEIRKLVEENIRGLADGSLDEHNLCNAMLGEIAAQLAEMNERAELGAAYSKLLAAGDEMRVCLEHDPGEPYWPTAARQAVAIWKAARADPTSDRQAAAVIGFAYKKLRAAGDAIVAAIDGMYAKGAVYPDADMSAALKVWRELNR